MVPANAWPACYASGWGTQFVDGLETWDTGGTWQNATYDDYDYQYQWTKTRQGQATGAVNSSATSRATGVEDGTAAGGAGLKPAARVQVRVGAAV